MAVESVDAKDALEAELEALLEKIDPEPRRLLRELRPVLRARFPTANELVYDYGTSLLIGYSPTDRGIDAIVSIAARADGVRLYLKGSRLPDPRKLLKGSGKEARYLTVEDASRLADTDVEALIAAATAQAGAPSAPAGSGKLVIKETAAAKRLRRSAKP